MLFKYWADHFHAKCSDSMSEVKISISVQDAIILHTRRFSTNCRLSAATAHESCCYRQKQRGGEGQWKAVLCVCLPCDNKGLTWPSPPSSACVVASRGPWSSSWKNQAGSLPPLQVRCEDEEMEMKNEMKKEVVSDKLVIVKSTTEVFEVVQLEIRLQHRCVT